jgi:hypothetical protein
MDGVESRAIVENSMDTSFESFNEVKGEFDS